MTVIFKTLTHLTGIFNEITELTLNLRLMPFKPFESGGIFQIFE